MDIKNKRIYNYKFEGVKPLPFYHQKKNKRNNKMPKHVAETLRRAWIQ
jgi:hypothetical protein